MKNHPTISARPWKYFYISWFLFSLCLALVNTTNVIMERIRADYHGPLWQPFVNEYSGVLSLFLLIPLIKWFDERFTFRRNNWKLTLFAHFLFTIPFSVLHSALFTFERKLIYPLFSDHYVFGSLGFELLYEYRKITIGYILVAGSLYGFRHYVQLQRLLELPDAHEESVGNDPKHFLRRMLAHRNNREVIIDTHAIAYLEAAGNYAILHAPDGQFKVRTTLAAIEQQLDPQNFVRVHRSYIVNIEAVKEIQPWFRGDQRILINDGTILNLSRRYRDQFGKLVNLMAPLDKGTSEQVGYFFRGKEAPRGKPQFTRSK